MSQNQYIITFEEPILITGANGFIGSKVVETLIKYGFKRLKCFVRPSGDIFLNKINQKLNGNNIEIIIGNLLNWSDCERASKDVSLIFHLAAGIEKTFAGCFMDSVIATRNVLEVLKNNKNLKRFIHISSIVVYSWEEIATRNVVDETMSLEREPELRFEPYTYGKVKQEELVMEYCNKFNIPYVILRPGEVYGPGKRKISGRVGINSFGFFIHLGGNNQLPLTYIDNCAEAIVQAGIKKGIDGECFNIVDDNLPTCKEFLKMYKEKVNKFYSLYLPYKFFYYFCCFWEYYSTWSKGQLQPVFNKRRCIANWKKIFFSNKKIKEKLGWSPIIPTYEALSYYFKYMKESGE